MAERDAGHEEVSVDTIGCSLGSVDVGALREIECTEEIDGRDRSVERMCEPYCSQYRLLKKITRRTYDKACGANKRCRGHGCY